MTLAVAPGSIPDADPAIAATAGTVPWESKTVDLGSEVHYADFGGSGPVMVLVHGIASSHLNWMGIGPELAKNHRVFAVDLPGYGHSALGDGRATVENSQSYLDRFIDHVAPGQRVVVFGHSMGGLVSLLEVAAQPNKVSQLILLAPAAPFPRRAALKPAAMPFLLALIAPKRSAALLRRSGTRLPTERVVRQALKRISAPTSTIDEEIIQAHIDLVNTQRERYDWVERALVESAGSLVKTTSRRRRYRAMLQGIQTPTLLMHGTLDRLVPFKAGVWLHRQRPDWSWRPLHGLGHMAQMEDAELALTTIREWQMAQRFLGAAA